MSWNLETSGLRETVSDSEEYRTFAWSCPVHQSTVRTLVMPKTIQFKDKQNTCLLPFASCVREVELWCTLQDHNYHETCTPPCFSQSTSVKYKPALEAFFGQGRGYPAMYGATKRNLGTYVGIKITIPARAKEPASKAPSKKTPSSIFSSLTKSSTKKRSSQSVSVHDRVTCFSCTNQSAKIEPLLATVAPKVFSPLGSAARTYIPIQAETRGPVSYSTGGDNRFQYQGTSGSMYDAVAGHSIQTAFGYGPSAQGFGQSTTYANTGYATTPHGMSFDPSELSADQASVALAPMVPVPEGADQSVEPLTPGGKQVTPLEHQEGEGGTFKQPNLGFRHPEAYTMTDRTNFLTEGTNIEVNTDCSYAGQPAAQPAATSAYDLNASRRYPTYTGTYQYDTSPGFRRF